MKNARKKQSKSRTRIRWESLNTNKERENKRCQTNNMPKKYQNIIDDII